MLQAVLTAECGDDRASWWSVKTSVISTIMIVEDDAINRMYLSALLKRNGYAVREYTSGVPLMEEEPFPGCES